MADRVTQVSSQTVTQSGSERATQVSAQTVTQSGGLLSSQVTVSSAIQGQQGDGLRVTQIEIKTVVPFLARFPGSQGYISG